MKPSRRAVAERSGHRAETIAAVWLSLKGYRILERRCRTVVGEIDIIAVRRRRLAFVEVKRRRARDEAAWSVTSRQQARIVRAAEHWLAHRPAFQAHDIGLDVVLVAPWKMPQHLRDTFRV